MRIANLKGAFQLNDQYCHLIQNQTILLVDDVMTTGATLHECSDVFLKKGAKQVFVLVAAKVSVQP